MAVGTVAPVGNLRKMSTVSFRGICVSSVRMGGRGRGGLRRAKRGISRNNTQQVRFNLLRSFTYSPTCNPAEPPSGLRSESRRPADSRDPNFQILLSVVRTIVRRAPE